MKRRPDSQGSFRIGNYWDERLDPRFVQDGPTQVLLCRGCEGMLSKWETLFARDVLRRIDVKGAATLVIEYDMWLPRFVASLAWRTLVYLTEGPHTYRIPDLREDVLSALETWRQFVLGTRDNPGRFELHMLPIPPIIVGEDQFWYRHDIVLFRPRAAPAFNAAFAWIKLPSVLLLGIIRQPSPRVFRNTRLRMGPRRWSAEPPHVPAIIRKLMQEEYVECLNQWRSTPGVQPLWKRVR